jgi:ribosome-binding protein aMBF1 (putative translation factor)
LNPHCDVNAADAKASHPKTAAVSATESPSPSARATAPATVPATVLAKTPATVPGTQSATAPGVARRLLALNLVRLRAQRGWSQEALAHESGLHRTFIAHVERQVRNASIDNVERLADALGVSVAAMFQPPPDPPAG